MYSIVSEFLKTKTSHISYALISKIKMCYSVETWAQYFHVKTKIS